MTRALAVLVLALTLLASPAMATPFVHEVADPSSVTLGQYTSLVLDAQGNPHISYYDVSNANLKYAERINGAWVIETVDVTGNVGQHTSLALDAQGNPRISYHEATNFDLKFAEKNGVAGWSNVIVDATGSIGLYTSLELDAQGNPRISYFDDTNDDLKYIARTGLTWSTAETVDAVGAVGQYSSLALDAQGNPRVSYWDGTEDKLKYAAKSGSTWADETVDPTVSGGRYSSLALDAQGNPCISYHDDTSDDLRFTDSAVHIESPVGGERWASGSTQTVRWRGSGSVTIQLSQDGGLSYTTLMSSVVANAVAITVPHLTTHEARVRISRGSPFSTSDSPGYFMIAPGSRESVVDHDRQRWRSRWATHIARAGRARKPAHQLPGQFHRR